ncbi:hypothetical protein [Pseudoflavonifractor phocaeensis]|uniref:hypothetical protein n=1 Tax=Pseudoflavonifractor phocaeensis TaxID=1870988 RepID=UPI00195B8B5E|nr:hypothetical protein [Pseudoflavonifractor phocaeensis]MBM6924716.1 hypothetical protein [Pseudoflavonifractor phocaeensis]
MKQWSLSLLALASACLLAACHPQSGAVPSPPNEPDGQSLASFSYEEDAAMYQAGDPGVKTTGFVNVDLFPIEDQNGAVERARNECTIEYNTTSEYYDAHTEMWRVDFFTAATVQENGDIRAVAGNCQSVYLDSDGVTQLIVSGE